MAFRNQKLQYFAVFTVSLITLTTGMTATWPSPSTPLLTSDDSPIGMKLSTSQISWVSSITMLGVLVGNLILGQLQDKFGRRGLLLISAVPTIITWLMIAFTKSYEILLAARFFNGLACVAPTMTSAVYIGEISEPSIRGQLSMFNILMIDVGIVIITAVGSYTTYTVTAIVPAVISVVFFVLFWWMPESPYYYLRKGDLTKANKSLQKLRNNLDVSKEIEFIKTRLEEDMKQKSNFCELFRIAKYRKIIFIGLGLKTLLQMSGIVAIVSFNKVIFEKASTGLDSSQSAIISTAVAIPSTLIGSFLTDIVGRKPLFYISTIGCSISLWCEFGYFYMQDYQQSDVSAFGWMPLFGILLFTMLRNFGITLAVIIVSEILPTNIKAVGLNVILVYNSILGYLVMFGFPLLVELWGLHTLFAIFAVCCLFGFCFAVVFIPETKGKSLEDIQTDIDRAMENN